MLMNNFQEVDFGVASFTVTSQRAAVTSFTIPVWRGSTAMLLRTNPSEKYFAYLNPFSNSVLLCMLLFICFSSLMMWKMAKTNPSNHRGYRQLHHAGLTEITLHVYGSLFAQGRSYSQCDIVVTF